MSDLAETLKLSLKNEHHLEQRIAELEANINRYENGYKGGCWTCESVGEKNIELATRNAKLTVQIAELQAQVKELEAALGRPLENAIEHIQHECYNDALSSIHEARAALAERNE